MGLETEIFGSKEKRREFDLKAKLFNAERALDDFNGSSRKRLLRYGALTELNVIVAIGYIRTCILAKELSNDLNKLEARLKEYPDDEDKPSVIVETRTLVLALTRLALGTGGFHNYEDFLFGMIQDVVEIKMDLDEKDKENLG